MGMFNEVVVSCPKCGEAEIFQSKSGSCELKVFTIYECPLMDFYGIAGDSQECSSCGHVIEIVNPFSSDGIKRDFSKFVVGTIKGVEDMLEGFV